MSYARRSRNRSILTSLLIIAALFFGLRFLNGRIHGYVPPIAPPAAAPARELAECAQLPGANDTLIVMKTGATELEDKLPIHFDTTLLCHPNFVIFSDHEEVYQGHLIHDALKWVDPFFQDNHEDFELWRRLKKHGRSVLAADELSGPDSKVSPMTGKGSNPGWKLDKWKFLPMMNATYNMYPDKKWYIFVETDTYLFWNTLLTYLSKLNFEEPWYIGSQMQIGDIVFAHGGSGFIASREALRLVVEFFVENQAEWENFTDKHWAGDCVLGKAFKDAGSPLTWAWPIIQGVKPQSIDYKTYEYRKRLWCYPSVSYHHLSPTEVEDIWKFEQDWLSVSTDIVRHNDVFKLYILPHITNTEGSKDMWDNMSDNFANGFALPSFDSCRERCHETARCVQFAYMNGTCTTSTSPRWGEPNPEAQSGWLLDRIDDFIETMAPCENEMWIYR